MEYGSGVCAGQRGARHHNFRGPDDNHTFYTQKWMNICIFRMLKYEMYAGGTELK